VTSGYRPAVSSWLQVLLFDGDMVSMQQVVNCCLCTRPRYIDSLGVYL
jgi:hypothetical protein